MSEWDFEVVASRGEATADSTPLSICLYFNENFDAQSEIVDGLTTGLDDLYLDTPMDYYEILVHQDTLDITIEGDTQVERRNDFFDSWWNNGDPVHPNWVGVHLASSNQFTGGEATGGQTSGGAFASSESAVDGTMCCEDYYVNSHLHEVLHCTINSNIQKVDDMGNNEHELGIVYSDGKKSPMASREESGQSGQCRSSYSASGESENLSWCEKQATELTIEQEF